MLKKLFRSYFPFILLAFWMAFIFIMSSFPPTQSDSQSGVIVDSIMNVFPSFDQGVLTFIVRKSAHFFEFFILGVLSSSFSYKFSKNYKIFCYFLIIIFTIFDEIHQLLVPGRSCEIRDICIDISGVMLGSLCFYLISRFYSKNRKK